MAYQSFEDLEVWQRGCRLAVDIFETFSSCRNFTMQNQVERAALSVPSNVAEGYERNSNKEFIRFLNISKGSCGELRTQPAKKPEHGTVLDPLEATLQVLLSGRNAAKITLQPFHFP